MGWRGSETRVAEDVEALDEGVEDLEDLRDLKDPKHLKVPDHWKDLEDLGDLDDLEDAEGCLRRVVGSSDREIETSHPYRADAPS